MLYLVGHGADRCADGSQFSSGEHRVWHKIRRWQSEQPILPCSRSMRKAHTQADNGFRTAHTAQLGIVFLRNPPPAAIGCVGSGVTRFHLGSNPDVEVRMYNDKAPGAIKV